MNRDKQVLVEGGNLKWITAEVGKYLLRPRLAGSSRDYISSSSEFSSLPPQEKCLLNLEDLILNIYEVDLGGNCANKTVFIG